MNQLLVDAGVDEKLVQEGVDSLLENGFTIVERSLSPEQCDVAAQLLDDLVTSGQAQEYGGAGGFGYSIHPLLTLEGRLADFYADPLVIAIMEKLFNDDAHLVHTGARLSDATHTPRIGWHDHRYWDEQAQANNGPDTRGEYPKRVLAAWYVEGCTIESGPLIALPRRYDDLIAPPSDDFNVAWPGEVDVICPPGSCVIFTNDLWHSAKAGTDGKRRHLFGSHFQGWNNPRVHGEDHVHEGPEVEAAYERNPLFAHIMKPRS